MTYNFTFELSRVVIKCHVTFADAVQDLEVNDGSADKPYFMSKDLMGILGENNDKEVAEAKKEWPPT